MNFFVSKLYIKISEYLLFSEKLLLLPPTYQISYYDRVLNDAKLDTVMTNSFGFGGTNGSMLLSNYDD